MKSLPIRPLRPIGPIFRAVLRPPSSVLGAVAALALCAPAALHAAAGGVVPVVRQGTDTELSTGTNTQGKAWSAAQLATLAGGGGGLDNVVEDTTPQLGGDLDLNGHKIGGVDATELGYVTGVTSAIQTQLSGKVTGPASATDAAAVLFDGTTGKLVKNSSVTFPLSVANGGTGAASARLALESLLLAQIGNITPGNLVTTGTTGTGSAAQELRYMRVTTGATAGSVAQLRLGRNQAGWSRGKATTVIAWGRPAVLYARVGQDGAKTTNGIARVVIGKGYTQGVAALDRKGIGFEIRNAALYGICHNGTTLSEVNLSTSVADTFTTVEVVVTSDGAGNVAWFIDGTSKGTSTGGPTSDSSASDISWQAEVSNGADSAAMGLIVMESRFSTL